jgi:DNA-3-methyladenine glycosylase II
VIQPRHPDQGHEIGFARPLDLVASLAPLGRSGDDLIDRFDGHLALRTQRLGPDETLVPYAAEVSDDPDRPTLRLHVPTALQGRTAEVADAIRAGLLTDGSALAELAAVDRAVAELARRYPGVVPILYTDPFTALIRSISAQQVNLRWAATVRARLAVRYGTRHEVGEWQVWSLHPEPLAAASVEELRALQLTTAKALSVIAVARAALAGELRAADLRALDAEALIAHLTRIRGIGRWSAEWFLARTLGRPRVVGGDLGVRKTVGRLYDTPEIPSELETRRLTEQWGAAATHAQALALHDRAVSPEKRPPRPRAP